MPLPPILRAPVFAACLFLASIAHGAPVPAPLSPLVVYGSPPLPSSPTSAPTSTSTSTSAPSSPVGPFVPVAPLPPSSGHTSAAATATLSPGAKPLQPLPPALPSSSTASSRPSSQTAWTVSSNFDDGDLSAALSVKKWAWGKVNVELITGIPSTAWASATPSPSSSRFKTNGAAAKSFPRVDLTNSTMLRVDFPEGSINPGNKSLPTGGIGLYATPLDLSSATNVTFSYSVFFPEDFDFVKGGKLPGLYGGHEGCSGGAESEDCFSTRTMFRKDGMGELYLYAPRDAQPAALCETPPLTYCDTKYGMSIGRGAWTFARGAWTTVRQNIRLNTPGIADGGIRIYVDDVLVISSDTVLFRKNLTKPKPTSTLPAPAASSSRSPASPPKSTFSPSAAATPSPSRGGGLLDGLLGKLGLSNLLIVDQGSPPATDSAGSMSLSSPSPSTSSATATSADIPIFTRPTPLLPPVFPSALAAAKKAAKESPTSAGLEGVMLHTFFGGSDPSWASPRDQHLYLDRLSLQIIS